MNARPAPASTLTPMLMERRVIVCAGAGGVGKTTLAAAMSVRAARAGRRVACLSIDPARRLADNLGVAHGDEGAGPRDITGLLGGRVENGGRLSFGMLDAERAFATLVRDRASSPAVADRILRNKLYRYLSGSLSGVQEYMALEQLSAIKEDPDVELVVLDTPPTVNALDFFTSPRRMVDALDGPLVRVMRRAYGGPGRIGFDLVGRWAGAVLKAMGRFTGGELLNEMMSFVDALSDLFGSFAERARVVESALRGKDVAFCLVATADNPTVRETREFRNRLAQLGLAVNAVVFNRVHAPHADDPPAGLQGRAAEVIRSLNAEWNEASRMEGAVMQRVKDAWEGLDAVVAVPLLPEGADRIEALDGIGAHL
ncbi:MAG: ArsA-related P-loop ATPase [Deltaproteobacteria bacterium]|nr:ArsA-related P-loop ATPase [Deltaproteobacteria bacterium]